MISTAATRLAGVIGWPVAHSLSPRLHSYWLQRYGIDGAYLALPVRVADFRTAVLGLHASGFAGANVTVPHKQAALALCDLAEPFARAAGAVNTLIFSNDGIEGRNTDGYGFLANLRAHGVQPQNNAALVLGAGGAARAICAALCDAGAAVTVTARSHHAAAELASTLGVNSLAWSDRNAALAGMGLLVNTTSGGMADQAPLEMDLSDAGQHLVVSDIIYAPRLTPLLRQAEHKGLRAVGGIGMLLYQAAPGFAAWFGRMPEVDQTVEDFVLGGGPCV